MSSKARRITALERGAEQARAARIAAQEEQGRRAGLRLPIQTLRDLVELSNESERDAERVRRIHLSVTGIARPLEHPSAEAARAWGDVVDTAPEDSILPAPPAGTADYWKAEADDWERALREEASETEDMRTAARWHAAHFRYLAALAQVIGEQP